MIRFVASAPPEAWPFEPYLSFLSVSLDLSSFCCAATRSTSTLLLVTSWATSLPTRALTRLTSATSSTSSEASPASAPKSRFTCQARPSASVTNQKAPVSTVSTLRPPSASKAIPSVVKRSASAARIAASPSSSSLSPSTVPASSSAWAMVSTSDGPNSNRTSRLSAVTATSPLASRSTFTAAAVAEAGLFSSR